MKKQMEDEMEAGFIWRFHKELESGSGACSTKIN